MYTKAVCRTFLDIFNSCTFGVMTIGGYNLWVDDEIPMLDTKSKIFFAVFFLAITLSIMTIYTNVMVLKSYHTFSEDDDIPDPTTVYGDVFEYFAQMRSL